MIDIETLSITELEELRDACSQRLLEMRPTTGLSLPELLRLLEEVKIVLRDQGKEWHSLDSWQWMDGAIHFWLNPKEQENHNSGWFTINDLIAWSRNRGAVMVEQPVEEDEDLWAETDGVRIHWLPTEQDYESSSEPSNLLATHS